jgi:hypothetical protein
MKKTILLLVAAIISTVAFSQLKNSRWKGTVKGDNPRNVILDFRKDTVLLYTVSVSEMVERMTFTSDNATFTVKKIDGQSDCDNGSPGIYNYSMQNGKMLITLSKDQCADRYTALDSTKWMKWKDHPAVQVSEAILKEYTGVYEFNHQHQLFVTLEKGVLHIEGPNNNLPKSPLSPESKTRFFLKIAGVELDFVKDASGKVVKMISHEEEDHDLKKIR